MVKCAVNGAGIMEIGRILFRRIYVGIVEDHWMCNCDVCVQTKRIKSIVESRDIDQLINLIHELYEALIDIDMKFSRRK
jgi:hypothetical protein